MKSSEQKEEKKVNKDMRIKNKRKEDITPEEMKIRKKYKINLLICLILAIVVEIYFIATNILSVARIRINFEMYLKISYMAFLIISILILEIAYKRKIKYLAIHGIELIFLATHLLTIERNILGEYIINTSYIWIIYYSLKALIIYTKENRRRLKQISDISEIVKEEKPVKKVAKKRKT